MENDEYTQLPVEERRPLTIQFFKQIIESGTFDKLLQELPDSVLFLAANGDIDLEATKMLVGTGFDIHACTESGQTSLMYALEHNAPSFAWALIKLGADIFATEGIEESTALFFTACTDTSDIAEYLIKKGLDVNHRSNLGDTPLIVAAQYGAENVVKVLLKNGADATAINEFGLSAEMEAARIGNEGLAILLRDAAYAQTKEQVNAEYRFSFDELFWKHYRKLSDEEQKDFCKRANMKRQQLSKIKKGGAKNHTKETVFKLIMGEKVDFHSAEVLLASCGFHFDESEHDRLVKEAIAKEDYDYQKIEERLFTKRL